MAMATYEVKSVDIFEKWAKYIHNLETTKNASDKRNFNTNEQNKKAGIIGQLAVHILNKKIGLQIDENIQLCLIDTDEHDGKLLLNNNTKIQVKTKNCNKFFSPDWSLMIPTDQYEKYDKNTIFFACVYQPYNNLIDVVGFIPYSEFNEKKRLVEEGDKQRDGFSVSGPPSYAIYYSELHNSPIEYYNFINGDN